MAKKKGWYDEQEKASWDKRGNNDHMKLNEPEGFRSGLKAFKDDMKKKNKNYDFDDNKRDRSDYYAGGGGGGGRRNRKDRD